MPDDGIIPSAVVESTADTPNLGLPIQQSKPANRMPWLRAARALEAAAARRREGRAGA